MKMFSVPGELLAKVDSLLHNAYDGTVGEGICDAVTKLRSSDSWLQTSQQLLLPALRQYKHNDGSEGFIPGYDLEETNEIVQKLLKPENSLWVVYDPEENGIVYSSDLYQHCHDHINDCLNHGCFEAANWVIAWLLFKG